MCNRLGYSLTRAHQLTFTKDLYSISYNETNTTVGSGLPPRGFVQVHCDYTQPLFSSMEAVGNITYFVTGNSEGPLDVDENSGEVFVKSGHILDYEQQEVYSLTVECSLNNETSETVLTNTTVVEVITEPVNEFHPVFPENERNTIFIQVPRSTPVGSVILSTVPGEAVQTYGPAVDQDKGEDGIVRYYAGGLGGAELPSEFIVNETTGAVLLNQVLTNTQVYTYRIFACDRTDRPIETCKFITVTCFVTAAVDRTSPTTTSDQISSTKESSSTCLLYTSPSPRDATLSRMPSSA